MIWDWCDASERIVINRIFINRCAFERFAFERCAFERLAFECFAFERLACSRLAFLSFSISILLAAGGAPSACAQSAGPRTVGDGTLFLFSPGRSEGYGVYGGDIGGQVGEPIYSRHHRLGQTTGIGSSTLETTSATSESTPVQVDSFASTNQQFGLMRPNLASPFAGTSGSPALSPFAVNQSNGIFSGSALTSGHAESPSSFASQHYQPTAPGVFQDIDVVPSFIKKQTRGVLPLSGSFEDETFKVVQPKY